MPPARPAATPTRQGGRCRGRGRPAPAAAGTSRPGMRILEEGQVAAGAPLLVGVEEVVDGRIVLVDGLLHEPQAENADVEVDVAGRVAGDAGDVVDPLEAHRCTVTIAW